jgi:hypothetical protein
MDAGGKDYRHCRPAVQACFESAEIKIERICVCRPGDLSAFLSISEKDSMRAVRSGAGA